ncbi:MAG TPA: hypothetical protein VK905_01290 [Bacillota bacterium]|nr:hypothetical protein [Bacillota bacterium]
MQVKRVSAKDLLIFFIPLGITSMLMMGSHSIISSALARTADAAAALAAFSVAQSISMMFESPCFALRRLFVSQIDDQDSFATLLKVTGITIAFVFAMQLTIAYSSIGRYIFLNLVGISEDLLPNTLAAYRVFMLLPVASAIRSSYQGLIIVSRKTHYLTMNILVRLATMIGLAALFASNTQLASGGAVGAIIMVSGMSMEAFMAFVTGRRLRHKLPTMPERGEKISLASSWIFFFPLIGAQFVQSFDRLFISAGLARTVSAEVSIAAYQVAWSTAWIFASVAFNIHQVVLVFVKDQESLRAVKKFAVSIGIAFSSLLFVLSVTPLGTYVLTNWIGTEAEITRPTLQMLTFISVIPFILSKSEIYAGILMRTKHTIQMTYAKVANLATLGFTVFIIGSLYPEAGGLLAAFSMIAGYLAEWAVLYYFGRKARLEI